MDSAGIVITHGLDHGPLALVIRIGPGFVLVPRFGKIVLNGSFQMEGCDIRVAESVDVNGTTGKMHNC